MSIHARAALACLIAIAALLPVIAIDSDCGGNPCTPLTTAEKQAILDMHNELRNRVARGDLVSDGHPPATDMNSLVWDDGLEAVAQAYVDTCPGVAHNPAARIQYRIERDAGNTKWGPDTETVPECSARAARTASSWARTSWRALASGRSNRFGIRSRPAGSRST